MVEGKSEGFKIYHKAIKLDPCPGSHWKGGVYPAVAFCSSPPHRRPYHGEVSHLGETEVVLTCVPCGEEVTEGPRERLQSQAMGTVICLFSEGSDTKGQKHCSRAHHTTPAWMLPVTESSRLYLQVLLVR